MSDSWYRVRGATVTQLRGHVATPRRAVDWHCMSLSPEAETAAAPAPSQSRPRRPARRLLIARGGSYLRFARFLAGFFAAGFAAFLAAFLAGFFVAFLADFLAAGLVDFSSSSSSITACAAARRAMGTR